MPIAKDPKTDHSEGTHPVTPIPDETPKEDDSDYQYRFSMKSTLRRISSPRTIIALIVGGAVFGLTFWRVYDFEWSEVGSALVGVNVWLLLLATALYYASFFVRGIRWRAIAGEANIGARKKMPKSTTLSTIILSGWFLNAVGFLRIGDVYRGWALADEADAKLPPSFGTVAAERAQDIVAVLALVLGSAFWLSVTDTGTDAPAPVIYGAFALGGILTAGIVTMRFVESRHITFLPNKITIFYDGFRRSTLSGLSGKRIVPQMGLGFAGWMLEAARFHFVAQALGFDLAFSVSIIAALAVAMLTTIPTPGGFGFVEPGLAGLLLLLGFNDADAIALTIGDRLISWVSVILIGGAVFFIWQAAKVRSKRAKRLLDSG